MSSGWASAAGDSWLVPFVVVIEPLTLLSDPMATTSVIAPAGRL